ncbi:MAG: exodeoxyribonuclease VII small subunit [Clostridia bacterium]|nr:exodeoxyribonuclease VII small subunit [Clostridia bacterium]
MNDKYTFEQALARLEEIVKGLENGSLPLDKSIELFEEGNALVKLCTQKLDAAEQKVRILTETAVGITEEDFNA